MAYSAAMTADHQSLASKPLAIVAAIVSGVRLVATCLRRRQAPECQCSNVRWTRSEIAEHFQLSHAQTRDRLRRWNVGAVGYEWRPTACGPRQTAIYDAAEVRRVFHARGLISRSSRTERDRV